MDELEIEKRDVSFHGKLNHILRRGDVKGFKAHVAAHPMQAGRLSHCLGLSDELAEVEMYKGIVVRSALQDLHHEASDWLKKRGIEQPRARSKKWGGDAEDSSGGKADLIEILPRPDQAPLNSPFRLSMYAEIASERSSEGTIMLDLAALYSVDYLSTIVMMIKTP